MATHLAHRIPWESIGEIYTYHRTRRHPNQRSEPEPLPRHIKQLEHVARVFSQTLREFKETDKTSEEDKEWLDPKRWGEYGWSMESGGGLIGIYDSLVWGYIELNLLLLDPRHFQPLMMPTGRSTMAMCFMKGVSGTGHGNRVAEHFKQAFEADNDTMRPLTPEVLDILRDHAKLMFKCMYLVSGENALLDDQTMVSALLRFFNWLRVVADQE